MIEYWKWHKGECSLFESEHVFTWAVYQQPGYLMPDGRLDPSTIELIYYSDDQDIDDCHNAPDWWQLV